MSFLRRSPGPQRLPIYLMAAGTVLFWGASFPLTKFALGWTGPTTIAFLRWAISSAVLVGWSLARGRLPVAVHLLRKRGTTTFWVALTGITLFYFLENLAIRYTTVINAGVLANLTAVFLALLGALWLKERLTRMEAAAMVAAFAGAALVSQGAGHLILTETGLRGDLLMIVATLFAALYSIGGKRLVTEYPADTVIAVVAVMGTLMLLPLALWEGMALGLPMAAWGALLVLGVGSGALANLWWMEILGYTSAARAGMILLLIPVVSTVIAVAFLGEALATTVLLGGVLVLAGVVVVERSRPVTPPLPNDLAEAKQRLGSRLCW
jgi:drug/metabolite transporter (DMT)-like permease